MNFYDYYDGCDTTTERMPFAAAKSLIENGFQVVPLAKGQKMPHSTIKSLSDLRQKPINQHNVSFFFDRDDIDIGIMLRKDMEVIDVDSKNKSGLSEEFLTAVMYGDPDLYERLVISKTPTGGLHILYRSETVGGEVNLARIDHSPNPLTIIERINETNKNFIKCAPSDGYEFIQGNPIELPLLSTEERTWLSGVAASFNKLIIPEVTKVEAEREDSPWSVFNEENNWEYTYNELKERGWTIMSENDKKAMLRRPGETKQHSAYLWKDTNSLYVFSGSTEFEPEKGYSPFGVYAVYYHDGNLAAACRKLASEGTGKNIYDEGKFWKRQGKKYIVKYTDLAAWLKFVGYRTYKNQIVKITDNIVSILDEKKLKTAFLNEVEYEMQDYFFDKVAGIFSDNGGIMAVMTELEDKFVKDDKETIWLFFKNYVVKVTASDILPFQYKDLNNYIWEDSIMNRNFYNADFTGCDASRFVDILGGTQASKLKKLLGYSLSRYKDATNPRAVILTEDIGAESEGESQGGSGKGLLFSFVRKFRKVCDFDGKSFRPTDTFVFQNVEADTNILFIDDLDKHFKFTSLFSILTGSLPVNKKNEKQMLLPFESSPKIFITSNYSVGAMDNSSERRKHEFPVVKHYGVDREPIDDFGRQFFIDWDDNEWCKFDNFMADCCRLYLADTSKKSIGNVTDNSRERGLVANTNREFIEYMDDQLAFYFFDFAPSAIKTYRGLINGILTTNGVDLAAFKEHEDKPDYFLVMAKDDLVNKISQKANIKWLTATKLTSWMNKWATARNVSIDTSYKRSSDGMRYYRIIQFPVPTLENESGNSGTEVGIHVPKPESETPGYSQFPF